MPCRCPAEVVACRPSSMTTQGVSVSRLPTFCHSCCSSWPTGGEARRRLRVIVIGGGTLYLLLWALAASGSRAGAIGTLVSLFVFVGLRGITEQPRHLTRRAVVAAAMILVLGILVLRTDYFPSILSDRVTRTFTPGDALSKDRVGLNEAGLRAFAESPLLGIGLDNFRFVAWRYGAPSSQAPHNIWIQFLVQVGVVGTAMMLLIIAGWS